MKNIFDKFKYKNKIFCKVNKVLDEILTYENLRFNENVMFKLCIF